MVNGSAADIVHARCAGRPGLPDAGIGVGYNDHATMSAVLNRKLKQAHEYLLQGDAARARTLCEEALRSAPRNPDAHYLHGLALLAEGQARKALPSLMQALAVNPRNGPALEYLGFAHL